MRFPAGHYYSPVVDVADTLADRQRIWKQHDRLAGVDLRVPQQLQILKQMQPLSVLIDWPVDAAYGEPTYHYANEQFPVLDAEVLFCLLGLWKPRRVIEVGSGFSSLVIAEANRRFCAGQIKVTCVEPYPRDFLLRGVDGISELVASKVELVPANLFDELAAGDVLFIDSSHVVKPGNDLQFLLFEVLPRLASGVYVHFHDIFLPDEYPIAWIEEGRSWNEQYVVHALLMDSPRWQVQWASHFMMTRHEQSVHAVFQRCPALGGGGSLWIRKL